MPVYNEERYLGAAVESILGQTLEDFVFLIVDDASTDRSAEIIRSYRDRRIQYLRNPENLGISATLNRGLNAAKTELIARMDADDLSHPDRLLKQARYLEAHPDCALLSSFTRNISEEGEVLGRNALDPRFFYFDLTFYCRIFHPSVIYRKSVIDRLGQYPARMAEDYLLWCRLIREHRFHTLPEFLLDYRISATSTSHVVHRSGYAAEEEEQVRENLRYFMGEEYSLPREWLECYRNNLEPLWKEGSVVGMAACIHELDRISSGIARKENVNRDVEAIGSAAAAKRARILSALLKRMPWPRKCALLACTGSWRALGGLILKGGYSSARRLFRWRRSCETA